MREKIRKRLKEVAVQTLKLAYQHRYLTAFGLSLIPLILLLLYWAIWAESAPQRTGFIEVTLWDWMELFVFPIIFGVSAWWFTKAMREVNQQVAADRVRTERDIANDQRHQSSLEAYYAYMTGLLIDRGLRTADEDNEVRSVARTRTLAILRSLDGSRKGQVLQFLHESNLISKPTIVDLTGAHLNGAVLPQANLLDADLRTANLQDADLQQANLRGAYLREANLRNANLREAYLREANLRGADMGEAYLREANLRGAYLRGANLRGANLRDANLRDANLRDANLRDAKLRGAYLRGADLRGADLAWTDLRGANLSGAILIGVNLSGANLSGATLNEANLSDANLGQANLREADVVLANLSGANLRGAELVWAYLVWANLSNAQLVGANMTEATLRGADLSGADLSEALVLPEQLAIVKSLEGATMPNGSRSTKLDKAMANGQVAERPVPMRPLTAVEPIAEPDLEPLIEPEHELPEREAEEPLGQEEQEEA